MALAPTFKGHRIGDANAKHTLEFYLDYVCPFSKKQCFGVRDFLLPLLKDGQASVIFRQTPQPWHASSTFVHEAGIAVAKLDQSKFWDFSYSLFGESENYYDEAVENKTPHEIRESLAELAQSSVGIDKKAFLELVSIGTSNSGNKVGPEMKALVKIGRQNGIHVTPTVLKDGLVDPSISSSFGKEEWAEYVKQNLN